MKITREVVTDLWLLGEAGEASEASRALVAEYLAGDPELAAKLREDKSTEALAAPVPPLSPDREARLFTRVRKRFLGHTWLMMFAFMFSGFAFGRIISDTTFTASPRPFIVTAIIAVLFWIAFLVTLVRDLLQLPRGR